METKGACLSRVRHIEEMLEEMYDEHVDSFTYMMEQPYTFHYFCEMYCSELYEEYLTLKESKCQHQNKSTVAQSLI